MLYRRILLTGANGLLGQELVALLSRHGNYDVLATARDSYPHYRDGSCGYVPLDITSLEDIRQIFLDFTPGIVINCAAMTEVDVCEEKKDECWRVNVDGVENLARVCRQMGTKLIQLSTDFIFDGKKGGYREDDRPDPVNFYGKSKLAAENVVKAVGLRQWSIIRTVLVYGKAHEMRRSNFVLWVINELSQGHSINVVTDQQRTPTYVSDLADGVERVVRFDKDGVYHISGSEHLSVFDFAHRVARFFELDVNLIRATNRRKFRQPAERPANTGFVILKAETELGYHPRSVEQALKHLSMRDDVSIPASSRTG